MEKMQFKKEFDIDKEFFTEKQKTPSKRRIAIKVFLFVSFITFILLICLAFSFDLNSKFESVINKVSIGNLKDAKSLYFDAMKFYDEGNYNKAIEYLNKQIQILDDSDAYNFLAKIYNESGDVDLAIYNYKKAIEFNPNFFEPNFELGKIYLSLKDYKNASIYFTNANNLQADNVEILSLTSETYVKTGRVDEAILLLEKILELEPDSIFANTKIGEIYFQKLDYKRAITYFENVSQLTSDEKILMQLAKSYFELNKFDAALSVIDDILLFNKENKQAQSLKKSIEFKKGLSKNQVKTSDIKDEKPKEVVVKMDKEVLSKYISEIEMPIKANWTPPLGTNLKKASVKFIVNKDGELLQNQIFSSSGNVEFDNSALQAIEASKPFPPLPDSLNKDKLDIIFTFDFNIQN